MTQFHAQAARNGSISNVLVWRGMCLQILYGMFIQQLIDIACVTNP